MVGVKDRLRQHEITRPEDDPGAIGSWNCSVATFKCSLYVAPRYFYFVSFAERSLKDSRWLRAQNAPGWVFGEPKKKETKNSFELIAASLSPCISAIFNLQRYQQWAFIQKTEKQLELFFELIHRSSWILLHRSKIKRERESRRD